MTRPARPDSDAARRPRPLAALAALALGLAWPAAPAQAACSVTALELPVKIVNRRAIATVGINGHDVPLIVDSGAYFSMLTDRAAAALGLDVKNAPRHVVLEGSTGRIDARMAVVDRLQLVSGELHDAEFIVGGADQGPEAMGLLGRNLLTYTDTEWDLAHGKIRFVYPGAGCDNANMAYWAGDTPVSILDLLPGFRAKAPPLRTRVHVNGIEVTARLDSGDTASDLPLSTARRAGIDPRAMTPASPTRGLNGVAATTWLASIATMEIGGENLSQTHLRVVDLPWGASEDAALGIDFFLSHHLYVSTRRSRVFMTWNGGSMFWDDVTEPPAAGSQPQPQPQPQR